ncbi:MAG: hypothetical protein ABI858_02190 [Pseudoxanthomonas sp.]
MSEDIGGSSFSASAPWTAPAPGAPAASPAAPAAPGAPAQGYAPVDTGHGAQAFSAPIVEAPAEGEAQPGTEATGAEPAAEFNAVTAVADMRSSLEAAGIDAGDNAVVATLVSKGLQQNQTPAQLAQGAADTRSHLETLYGTEGAQRMIGWARKEFQQMAAGNPNLIHLAEKSGAGNSLLIIKRLAERGIARHYKQR